MAAPAKTTDRPLRNCNPFLYPDDRIFQTLVRGEWTISGSRGTDLHALTGLSARRASYLLKPLRTQGLIKKVASRYKDYLTQLGRRPLVTAPVIREHFMHPTLIHNAL